MPGIASIFVKSPKFWFSRLALISLIVVSLDIHGRAQASDKEFRTTEGYAIANGCEYLAEQAKGATFVLYLPSQKDRLVCNLTTAKRGVLPASTFKIAHALIALETEAINDEFKKEKSDGRQRAVTSWNQPTSLVTGMENSTVWFYQRVAERVGIQNEREWLKRLNYGNADMGPSNELTTFWLTGSLRISALEQINFLDLLRRGRLEASGQNQHRVANMMVVGRSTEDTGSRSTLYAKSGAVLPIGKTGDIEKGKTAKLLLEGIEEVGWYVGWVERSEEDGGDAVFALHLPMHIPDALAKRKTLTFDLLGINGIKVNHIR